MFDRSCGNIGWCVIADRYMAVVILVQADDVEACIHLAAKLLGKGMAVFERAAFGYQLCSNFGMIRISVG